MFLAPRSMGQKVGLIVLFLDGHCCSFTISSLLCETPFSVACISDECCPVGLGSTSSLAQAELHNMTYLLGVR